MRDGCIHKLKQTTYSGKESPKVYEVVPFPVPDANIKIEFFSVNCMFCPGFPLVEFMYAFSYCRRQ